MKAIAITHRGVETTTQKELKELLKKDSEIKETVALFDATKEVVAQFAYLAHSIKRTGILLDAFTISAEWGHTKNIFEQRISKLATKGWLNGKTFKVESERNGHHEFNSQSIMETVGELLLKTTTTKVSMSPDIIVFVYTVNNDCYVMVDFCGFDLSKRDYKIFTHPASLNGVVAYHLIREAELKEGETILDPFCGGGTIAIEAALYCNNISPQYFRKDKFIFLKFLDLDVTTLDHPHQSKTKIHSFDNQLRYFSATRKNAKIANVEKLIHISKVDVEWLDIKLKEGEIDVIITAPPAVIKTVEAHLIKKVYHELFHQSEYILAKTGRMVVIVEDSHLLTKALPHHLQVTNQKEVWQGEKKFIVVFIKKNTKNI